MGASGKMEVSFSLEHRASDIQIGEKLNKKAGCR